MLFPTATFAIFFLIVLPLSWLLMPKVDRWRPFIIAASYVFYAWWDWRFVFLLAGCTLWNQALAGRIHRATVPSRRKALLWLALAGNLAVLGYFKYYDFFVDSSDNLLSVVGLDAPVGLRSIILPVGISFYTFMAISYVVDMYRGETRADDAREVRGLSLLLPAPRRRADRPARASWSRSSTLPRDPRRVDTSRAFYLIAPACSRRS